MRALYWSSSPFASITAPAILHSICIGNFRLAIFCGVALAVDISIQDKIVSWVSERCMIRFACVLWAGAPTGSSYGGI